jgi:hypothetical protein
LSARERPILTATTLMNVPRIQDFVIAPDGTWAAVCKQVFSPAGDVHLAEIWRVECNNNAAPQRILTGYCGIRGLSFLEDGSLIFASQGSEAEPATAGMPHRLWRMLSGEKTPLLVSPLPGDIEKVVVATQAQGCLIGAAVDTITSYGSGAVDGARTGTAAHLFESYPMRFDGRYLAHKELHLFVVDIANAGGADGPARDVAPDCGHRFLGQRFAVSPDGTLAFVGWFVDEVGKERRPELVEIELATGHVRVLAADDEHDFYDPAVSPNGRYVTCIRRKRSGSAEPPDKTLWLTEVDGMGARDLVPSLDLWPWNPVWSSDSDAVFFTADSHGGRPIF